MPAASTIMMVDAACRRPDCLFSDTGTSGDGNSNGNSGVTCGVHRTPLRVTHVTNTPLTLHSGWSL